MEAIGFSGRETQGKDSPQAAWTPQPQGGSSIAGIICTHNRDRYLGAAIASLLAQDLPQFEVWVVDNASTDNTRSVVEPYLSHPQFHYVYEENLGLSVARNRGARETQAEILAYLDDDAEAAPDWLRHLQQAYHQDPRLAVAGGKVTLIWPYTPPHWLSKNLMGALGDFDLGSQPLPIQDPRLTPRGVNYSVRRSFLESIGGFDPQLGRVGKKLLSNEELYVTELAIKQGWGVAYVPQAQVGHHVSPERMNRRWFLERSWWQGVSEYYRDRFGGVSRGQQFRRGGERLVRGIYKGIKFLGDPPQSFDNWVYAYGQLGYFSHWLGAMFEK
jgi:glycosyltransferase involved in cell wall biosynthesis